MQFLNALTGLQWAIATAIPIGVIALYFLKLKRQPVQVPSTFLWQKSVEDLHVNSLFQRLRKNLLLLLQLLILALALLALLRPAWFASKSGGQRHVIVIDNSASMSATDVEPNRLEAAKKQAITDVIDKMESNDIAMIIAFNDSAGVVQSYTSNRQLLRERLNSIEPTQRTTNLREALEVASGLANPQSFSAGARDETAVVEDIGRPQLHLFTDGGFPDVKDFSLGSLSLAGASADDTDKKDDKDKAYFNVVGKGNSNVAIVGMMVRRNEEHPEQIQVFARLYNFSSDPVSTNSELFLDGELKDAREVKLEPKSEKAVAFDLDNLEQGVLELRLDAKDSLMADNVARCVVGNVRRGKVLFVTRGNRWLDLALSTEAVQQVAEIERATPDVFEIDDYKQKAATGHYDLIIYDGCTPDAMPQCNTLFWGTIPKIPALGEPRKLIGPVIAEVNDTHPLFRFLNLDDVAIYESLLPELPQGTEVLVESGDGALAFLLTREGFWDCVIGFGFERDGEKGKEWNTDWFRHRSFPLFVFNAVRVLGNVQDSISEETILPGQTVVLRSESLAPQMQVKDPAGKTHKLDRTGQGNFLFNDSDVLGVYQFGDSQKIERRFAVNLFDTRESDIEPRGELTIGHTQVAAKREANRARQEAWRWLVLAAFAVLLAEWYIYNRRVYI